MKRSLYRFSLALAFLVVVGTAVGYYCYGPLIQEKPARFDYYRGWVAAWRAAFAGRYAYSFDRYLVDGLPEYALRKNGIAAVVVPAETRWAPYYLAGFDSCMADRLKKKLACDFPEGYVKGYLKTGSIDLTRNQPVECPVHKRPMVVKEIPFEVVYFLTIARPKSEREIAAEAGFPFPESSVKVNMSLFARPRYARTRVCDACTESESLWLAQQSEPNKSPKPTPAGSD